MLKIIKHLKNKELLIALYFLLFIFGFSLEISSNFYNEFRVLEIILLLGFSFGSYKINDNIKLEIIFFLYIFIGGFLWRNYEFIVAELLLFYLLYRSFLVLNYNEIVVKLILFFSFFIFILFPFSLFDYLSTGIYRNWYPMPWSIRIYDSYFLIISIFSLFFYLNEAKYRNLYLVIPFVSFSAILLDGGRSTTLAYTLFIGILCLFNSKNRLKLLFFYFLTCFFNFLFYYIANLSYLKLNPENLSNLKLKIVRDSTSGRYDLWENAFKCWAESPIMGCGFYQLDRYSNLSAHPHNLFIQILSETGLIGFLFLFFLIYIILRNIGFNVKENYFFIAALLAIVVEISFSGIYIYPVTQLMLLWFFIFILKNPHFDHAEKFQQVSINKPVSYEVIYLIVFCLIALIIFYFLFENSVFSFDFPSTPPRFWEYGYRLF